MHLAACYQYLQLGMMARSEEMGTVAAGICFGRTPLIKLSPKKTWEGFFGGLLLTVAAAWVLADIMSRYKWMVCPRTVWHCFCCHMQRVVARYSSPLLLLQACIITYLQPKCSFMSTVLILQLA